MPNINLEILDNIEINAFFKDVEEKWKVKQPGILTILGWQDGNWFKVICDENGGAKNNSMELFENIPVSMKVNSYTDFFEEVEPYCKEVWIGSKNDNYKFIYDIYLWQDKYHWIFNPYLKKLILKRIVFWDKFFGRLIRPQWIDENLILQNQIVKKPPYFRSMASGNKALVLDENINFDNFYQYAMKWMNKLGLKLKSQNDSLDERVWLVSLEDYEFYLAYDIWSPEISLEPKDDKSGRKTIEIGQSLGIDS